MKTFAERIKALRAEVEALKAVKSKSSTVLNTVTKEIQCTATIYRADGSGAIGPGLLTVRDMGLIEIIPTDSSNPLIFSYAQPAFADRGNRPSSLRSWMTANGNPAVLVDPGTSSSVDGGMAYGSTKTVTLTVYITATGDFTTSISTIRYTNDT